MKLYKRNAKGQPLVWSITANNGNVIVEYGLVGGTLHKEEIPVTLKNANEVQSRINAKQKEGYKELNELKDNINLSWAESTETQAFVNNSTTAKEDLIIFLHTYLPKYSTTSEGFVLPMLAKVLEDNKPFEKFGTMLGQWKINGLRCIVGAEKNSMDLFNPITLTYHSRTGEDWTPKMKWMDEILLPKISQELIDMMIEEGACLDGELYLPGFTVNDINSFVKNTQLPQHYKLQYWCYDICCENMTASARDEFRIANIEHTEGETLFDKKAHLNNKKQLFVLPTYSVYNFNQAMSYRDNFIERGFEGLIVRNPNAEYQFGKRNQSMFKYKKIDDGIFEIVDIKEDKRGLPIFVLKNDINDELFECTINATQEKQREYAENKVSLIGKKVFVEYRERSGVKQVPFHSKIIQFV